MNLSKYETLAVVMEQQSLTAAARELGCTQSAVSHCIDSLECRENHDIDRFQ